MEVTGSRKIETIEKLSRMNADIEISMVQEPKTAQPENDVESHSLSTDDTNTIATQNEGNTVKTANSKRGTKRVQYCDNPLSISKVTRMKKRDSETLTDDQSAVACDFKSAKVPSSTQLSNPTLATTYTTSEKTKSKLKRFSLQEKDPPSNKTNIGSAIFGLSGLSELTDQDLELD